MEEVWKDITGYEWLYQVSNLANIRSLQIGTRKRWLCQTKWRNINKCACGNYQVVDLCKNWAKKTFMVHRLVAIAFIPNPNNKRCVCHIIESFPSNDKLENLYWGTYKENTQDMISKWRSKLTHSYWKGRTSWLHHGSKKVIQYDLWWWFINKWNSIKDARIWTWVTSISFCVNWKQKTAGGFIWKFASDLNGL